MLIGEDNCDMVCEGCEKDKEPLWCLKMILENFLEAIKEQKLAEKPVAGE